jgi:hypothetical protein
MFYDIGRKTITFTLPEIREVMHFLDYPMQNENFSGEFRVFRFKNGIYRDISDYLKKYDKSVLVQ